MTEALVQLFGSIEPHWRVLIFAMLPVTELRASLPLGVIWGLTPGESLWWSLSGNFLPIIPLLLFLPWFFRIMARWKPLARPLHDLANHQLRKGDQVRRYGMIGLTLLVAIPLPMTGIWTGCLVAVLLSLPFWSSLMAISAGMVIAGIAIYLATNGVIAVTSIEYGEYLLIMAIFVVIVAYVYKRRRK